MYVYYKMETIISRETLKPKNHSFGLEISDFFRVKLKFL